MKELVARKEKKVTDEKELSEKLLQLCLLPLSVIFLHPIKSKPLYYNMFCMLFSTMSIAGYYWAGKYAVLYSLDIAQITQIMSSFGLCTTAQLKVVMLLFFKPAIRRLLDNKKRFWSVNDDPKLKQIVVEIYSTAVSVTKVFTITVILTFLLFETKPIYDKGALMTLQWYNEAYYKQVVLFQGFFGLFMSALLLGFNGLFVSISTDVRVQFKILNWMITHRKNDGSRQDMIMLKKYVLHHRFLLSCVKDIEQVFMHQTLSLYALTIFSTCAELYTVTEIPTSFNDKCRSLIYCSSLVVQLAMFCFPADALKSEISLLSESLYLSNWEEGSRSLQTWMPFVIMATQKVDDFQAFGMVAINNMAFVTVFKSTFSFLTLMRNMK